MTSKKCPICACELSKDVEEGIIIDVCDAHGIWLDTSEFESLADIVKWRVLEGRHEEREKARYPQHAWLDRLVDRLMKRLTKKPAPKPKPAPAVDAQIIPNEGVAEGERRCAVCGMACQPEMKKDLWGRGAPVIIDVCPSHGTWFDSGELGVLLHRVERNAKRFERGKKQRVYRFVRN